VTPVSEVLKIWADISEPQVTPNEGKDRKFDFPSFYSDSMGEKLIYYNVLFGIFI